MIKSKIYLESEFLTISWDISGNVYIIHNTHVYYGICFLGWVHNTHIIQDILELNGLSKD